MKLSVVMLLVLGIVAAGATAVMLAAMRTPANRSAAGIPEQQVIVAAKPLEPYSVVLADGVEIRKVPAAGLPKGCLSDPVQVIGKTLRLPMAEGQAFTEAGLAADDSPQSVASRLLQPGKRAKTIALSDDAAMRGLLYPGCAVDVLWCFNGSAAQGNPMSKVVLENIRVLAVNKQTALSSEDPSKDTASSRAEARHGNLVTLQLDARQAEILQVALDQGTIALVLRNPTDTALDAPQPQALSGLAEECFPAKPDRVQAFLCGLQEFGKTVAASLKQVRPVEAPRAAGQEWETTIIRGPKLERATFIVSTAE